MRCIVAGSRNFSDFDFLKLKLDRIFRNTKSLTILSGGARGADALGEMYANFYGYDLEIFKADWDLYGKRAGIIRNMEMGDSADALVAFWDYKSRGTQHMIEYAKKINLKVRVVKIT